VVRDAFKEGVPLPQTAFFVNVSKLFFLHRARCKLSNRHHEVSIRVAESEVKYPTRAFPKFPTPTP